MQAKAQYSLKRCKNNSAVAVKTPVSQRCQEMENCRSWLPVMTVNPQGLQRGKPLGWSIPRPVGPSTLGMEVQDLLLVLLHVIPASVLLISTSIFHLFKIRKFTCAIYIIDVTCSFSQWFTPNNLL